MPDTLPRPARSALLLLCLCMALPGRTAAQNRPAQREHRADFEPAEPAVYSVLKQFYQYDRSLPLAARIVEDWREESGHYQNVVFTTQSGGRVPGTLALPLDDEGRHPAVLLLHGLGNDRDRWWEPDRVELPRTLLDAGIAVFAIDLALHGERSVDNDYQSPVYLTLGDSLYVRNRDMVVQSTLDARRALDYLRTRDDIDANRLCVAGYSMGGMIALVLSALGPELRGVAASAVPTTNQPAPIDPFHFVPHAQTSVLLQIGRTDWLSSPEDIERLVGLLPTGRSEVLWYDSGHSLPPTFARDVAAWLRSTLNQ